MTWCEREAGELRLLGTITMPGVARSARAARAFVRGIAPQVDDEAMADIVLCVDELVANAVEHTASGTGGQITVVVSARDDILRVTVLDQGGAREQPRVCTDLCAEDGRGLLLVDALSKSWGSHPALNGSAVWAEFHAVNGLPAF
ncbi:ATP-binding protein [Actinomadura madurae]|uniref:Anti-sigma regulatory factor (Ser/Thr protein kinase) n=1 Tax=Actinomadura madurae TaxID=1993 RepID=A0A1I5X4J4_9ACTN|nr:ATP-binding protein [Actinomadura madurae]SFQ26791.1 Anti-sigma regulatory factor (Ser/Thr protein kinase) [Actinomadura madurae]SPT60797.1 Histidine kinase-, DNA gyrase B-, and HSP90-like ATPase [Actinomadura madurae]